MNRDVKYFMSLPYKILIEPIPEEEGGGFEAFIPQLGRMTMTGAGDTPEEALENLRDVQETLFKMWIEEGVSIQEPEMEIHPEAKFSGRILLRTTKEMHRELVYTAETQGVSLNSYLNQAIQLGYSLSCFKKNLKNTIAESSCLQTHDCLSL